MGARLGGEVRCYGDPILSGQGQQSKKQIKTLKNMLSKLKKKLCATATVCKQQHCITFKFKLNFP